MMSDAEKNRVVCEGCKATYSVEKRLAGRTMSCQKCSGKIEIPPAPSITSTPPMGLGATLISHSRSTTVRCDKCGILVNNATGGVYECPQCKNLITISENIYHKDRREYEIVKCPRCGRVEPDVTGNEITCGLCKLSYDVMSNLVRTDANEITNVLLKVSISLVYCGLGFVGLLLFLKINNDFGLSLLAVLCAFLASLWLAAIPFLAFCWRRFAR